MSFNNGGIDRHLIYAEVGMNKGYVICTEQVLLPIMTTNYREIVFHSEILKRVKN